MTSKKSRKKKNTNYKRKSSVKNKLKAIKNHSKRLKIKKIKKIRKQNIPKEVIVAKPPSRVIYKTEESPSKKTLQYAAAYRNVVSPTASAIKSVTEAGKFINSLVPRKAVQDTVNSAKETRGAYKDYATIGNTTASAGLKIRQLFNI